MEDPIEALMRNDATGFKDAVTDILMAKLGERLELEKVSVASSLFGDSEQEEMSEESESDDDSDDDSEDDEDEDDDLAEGKMFGTHPLKGELDAKHDRAVAKFARIRGQNGKMFRQIGNIRGRTKHTAVFQSNDDWGSRSYVTTKIKNGKVIHDKETPISARDGS